MKYIVLDFSEVKSWWELHEYFKMVFELPDYYGRNMDALWDCLRCSFEEDTTIMIRGLESLPEEMEPMIAVIRELFQDLEAEEREVTIRYEDNRSAKIEEYLI